MENDEVEYIVKVSAIINPTKTIKVKADHYDTDYNNNLTFYNEEGYTVLHIHTNHWYEVS